MFNLTWYHTLNKPPFTPPAWVFAPAWTFLYITIFLALLVYGIKPYSGSKNWGFTLFFLQLLLNLVWSPVFFGIHNIGMAFAIIVLLDIFVILNAIEFYKVSKTSGNLLLPYFIWLLYATYLNAGYFVLN